MDRGCSCSQEGARFLMPDALAPVWYEKFMDILQHHESAALEGCSDPWAARQMDNRPHRSCLLDV